MPDVRSAITQEILTGAILLAMKKLLLAMTSLALFLGLASLTSAANASTPTPTTTKPVHATQWTYGSDGTITAVKPGSVSPADLGICKGTFEGPEKSNNSVFTSVFIQCTSPAAVSAGAALDKCVRTGGPDDFSCTTVGRNRGSTSGKGYYLNVPVYYSPCQSGEYRPRAYYQTVNGVSYPDVTGNIVNVTC